MYLTAIFNKQQSISQSKNMTPGPIQLRATSKHKQQMLVVLMCIIEYTVEDVDVVYLLCLFCFV